MALTGLMCGTILLMWVGEQIDEYGIVNGIDYDVWNPKTDRSLKSHYDVSNLKGKAANKSLLRKI